MVKAIMNLFRRKSEEQQHKTHAKQDQSAAKKSFSQMNRAERRRIWKAAWSEYNHDGSGY